MIPAAAQDLLSTLTSRLLKGMPDNDRHQTRRVIGKLAMHFSRFNCEQARNMARAGITLALALASDETLAEECISACKRANREAEQDAENFAKLDQIPEMVEKLREIERMFTRGAQ